MVVTVLLFNFVFSLIFLFDAKTRKDNYIFWAIFILLLGPLAIGFYITFRNLKLYEIRVGGKIWNIIKNIVFYFSIYMFVFLIIVFVYDIIKILNSDVMEYELNKVIWLNIMGSVVFLIYWFIICTGLLLIGLIFKRNRLVERGNKENKSVRKI